MARITTLLIKVRLDDYSADVTEGDLDDLVVWAVAAVERTGHPVVESARTKTLTTDG